MSIGSIFICADNGQYFKNPAIRGEDFFIVWDEDEPTEIVIKRKFKRTRTDEELLQRANAILADLKIKAKIISKPQFSMRCFSKNSFKMLDAISLFIEEQNIPADIINEFDEMSDSEKKLFTNKK